MSWTPNLNDFHFGKIAAIENTTELPQVDRKNSQKTKVVLFKKSDFTLASSDSTSVKFNEDTTPIAPDLSNGIVRLEFDYKAIQKLKNTIRDLGLTIREASELLDMSLSNLNKLLAKTKETPIEPNYKTRHEVELFLELASLLKENTGKKHHIRKLLRTKLIVFGNRTPLEFAEQVKEDKLISLLGAFKRIYS